MTEFDATVCLGLFLTRELVIALSCALSWLFVCDGCYFYQLGARKVHEQLVLRLSYIFWTCLFVCLCIHTYT